MLRRIRSILRRPELEEPESAAVLGNLFATPRVNNEETYDECEVDITIIWLTTHAQDIDEHSFMQSLRSTSNNVQVFHSETEMLASLESMVDKNVFLVVHHVTDTLLTALQPLKQTTSVFICTPVTGIDRASIVGVSLSDREEDIEQRRNKTKNDERERIDGATEKNECLSRRTVGQMPLATPEAPAEVSLSNITWCSDELHLVSELKTAYQQSIRQKAAISFFGQAEAAMHYLSRGKGSFLFFQVFKTVLLSMRQTKEAKRMMVSTCRDYYRGNARELANIDEFEKNYKSVDAIPWYTKETFIYKLVNKALRTRDIDALYRFRFYIVDLSLQLKQRFDQRKDKGMENILRLYRASRLSHEEISYFQQSIGDWVSTKTYLSTSAELQVAYGFATTGPRKEGLERAIFEYSVDLTLTNHTVFLDIREFSAFPEEAEVLFDIGAAFQVDSCTYNSKEDLWLVNLSACDNKIDNDAADFINYQKSKTDESNMTVFFGDLLVEMGDYAKASKYFDTILQSSKPSSDETACIYHNIGRAHQIRGEYGRALACLHHAYETHSRVRPPRLAGAAKAMKAIGIVYFEQGNSDQAINSFERALSLYKKSGKQSYEHIAKIFMNLGYVYCQHNRFRKALSCFVQARKIYKRHLPPDHLNIAFALNNIGTLYYQQKKYDVAFATFMQVLAMREKTLLSDHPDVARALHNLAVMNAIRGDHDQAELYFQRAAACTLPETHPFMQMVKSNVNNWQTAKNQTIPIEDLFLVEKVSSPDLSI